MKPWAYVCWFLFSLASAVYMEDAFVQDWLKPLIGNVEKLDIVSNQSVIAWTGLNQLVRLDFGDGDTKVVWRVDLSMSPILEYFLSPNLQYIVTYNHGGDVSVWESSTGTLIQTHTGVGTIEQLPAFLFTSGIVVLSGGEMLLLHNDGSRTNISSNIKSFRYCQHGDMAYVVDNSGELFTVSANGATVSHKMASSLSFKYLDILDMRDGVVVTGNSFINLESESIDSHSTRGTIGVLSQSYYYSFSGSKIDIFKLKGEAPVFSYTAKEVITSVKQSDGIASWLAVYTDKNVHLFTLNDFLYTGLIDSISIRAYPLDSKKKSAIVSTERIWLVTIVRQEPNIISLASVTDDHIVESHISLEHYLGQNYVLIDKPQTENTKILFHSILDSENQFPLTNWILRVRRHLSELGAYVASFAAHVDTKSGETFTRESQFGLAKLLVFFEASSTSAVALHTESGKPAWKSELPQALGSLIEIIENDEKLYFVFEDGFLKLDFDGKTLTTERTSKLKTAFKVNDQIYATDTKSKLIKLLELDLKVDDQLNDYYVEVGDDLAIGFEINSNQRATWSYPITGHVVASSSMPALHQTVSAGISKSDKTILYKYLNRNLVAILTQRGSQLNLELLDGVTGSRVFAQKHDIPNIDFNSVSLTMADNWIVYSYYISEPHWEQRITVVDLFAVSYDPTPQSAFNSTSDIQVSTKTFIYEEKITSLVSTFSKHGITLKSIVALTSSGKLSEIPKYILNSRRIDDREMTQSDLADDFRMLPYEPIIKSVGTQVVNHVDKFIPTRDTKLLVKETDLESTSIICAVNDLNYFCSNIQPSLSYDVLSSNFDKTKLLLTMAVLLVAYYVTKPFVASKKLNAQWTEVDA